MCIYIHLFFECSFWNRVWLGNLKKCLSESPPYEWDAIVESGVKDWKDKGLKVVLCQLVLQFRTSGGREIILGIEISCLPRRRLFRKYSGKLEHG
jgi:hypothetical protein